MIRISAALRKEGYESLARQLELSVTEGPRNLSKELRTTRGLALILEAAQVALQSPDPDIRKLGFRIKSIARSFEDSHDKQLQVQK